MREEQKMIKCNNCDFETGNENSYMDHIIENHSTIHICHTCSNRFPSKNEMVEHMKREHGFQRTTQTVKRTSTRNNVSHQQQNYHHHMKCFDCGVIVRNKDDLMKHKNNQY